MTRHLLMLSFSFLIFAGPSVAQAQASGEDICCFLGKVSGEEAQVRTEVTSNIDCKPGKIISGYKACKGTPDPQNLCPMFEKKVMCATCGFFWAGESCLAEDPKVKAKEELEAERAKKEAAEKAKAADKK